MWELKDILRAIRSVVLIRWSSSL